MPTPPGPLTRPNYLSWPSGAGGAYQADADPNNAAFDPATATPATGYPLDGDAALDDEQYHRPLERLHGMGLHGAGVAFGMQLTCDIGKPQVTILPGLALDPAGRHIYLAAGGQAEIGLSPVTGTPADLTAVPPTGAILPTTGLPAGSYPGSYYVVAQWRETWAAQSAASNQNNSMYSDTPWLRLVTAASYDPGLQVILGEVALDMNAKVTSAGYGDVGGIHQRTSVSLPAQGVQLLRAVTTPTPADPTALPGADSVPWGAVRAREAGGVEIAVATASDQVEILNDAGGTFANLAVGAGQATFGDLSNPGINLNGSEATIFVGAPGNYGDVLVSDDANHLAVSLVGDTAHVIVGGETHDGQVRMKNAQAQDTMSLDASTGAAVVQRVSAFANSLIDVDATFFHVHGADLALDGRSKKNNRALVDWGNLLIINFDGDYPEGVEINSRLIVDSDLNAGGVISAQGVPLMGNPARKVVSWRLWAGSGDYANDGGSNSHTIDLLEDRQFTAYVSVSYIAQAPNQSASATAGISAIDNSPVPPSGSDSNVGPVFPQIIVKSGRFITFYVAAGGDSISIQATIIVFYE